MMHLIPSMWLQNVLILWKNTLFFYVFLTNVTYSTFRATQDNNRRWLIYQKPKTFGCRKLLMSSFRGNLIQVTDKGQANNGPRPLYGSFGHWCFYVWLLLHAGCFCSYYIHFSFLLFFFLVCIIFYFLRCTFFSFNSYDCNCIASFSSLYVC